MPHLNTVLQGNRPAAGRDSFPPGLGRMFAAAAAVEAGEEDRAHALLGELPSEPPATHSPSRRLIRLFARGLLARLEGDDPDGADPAASASPDRLATFRRLLETTPLVTWGHAVANAVIRDAVADAPALHVIDLGLGSGNQWLAFLDSLAAARPRPRQFRLTGIGAPADAAGEALCRRASELRLDFRFEALATPVADLDFGRVEVRPDQALAVNAAFALHRVPADDGADDPARSRDAVLWRLRKLPLRVLTLVEPDVEHNALPLLPRVYESWLYYRAVFEALGELLPPDLPERASLEEAFFGPEIGNVLGGEGPRRVERHERLEGWQARLMEQGFAPADLLSSLGGGRQELRLRPSFTVQEDRSAVRLAWRGKPLVAASAWRPACAGSPSAESRRSAGRGWV